MSLLTVGSVAFDVLETPSEKPVKSSVALQRILPSPPLTLPKKTIW